MYIVQLSSQMRPSGENGGARGGGSGGGGSGGGGEGGGEGGGRGGGCGGGEGGGEGGSMIRQTQPKYSDVSDRRRPRVPGEKTQLVPVQLRISQQSASLLHSPLITHAVGGGDGCKGGGCKGGGGGGGGGNGGG